MRHSLRRRRRDAALAVQRRPDLLDQGSQFRMAISQASQFLLVESFAFAGTCPWACRFGREPDADLENVAPRCGAFLGRVFGQTSTASRGLGRGRTWEGRIWNLEFGIS